MAVVVLPAVEVVERRRLEAATLDQGLARAVAGLAMARLATEERGGPATQPMAVPVVREPARGPVGVAPSATSLRRTAAGLAAIW